MAMLTARAVRYDGVVRACVRACVVSSNVVRESSEPYSIVDSIVAVVVVVITTALNPSIPVVHSWDPPSLSLVCSCTRHVTSPPRPRRNLRSTRGAAPRPPEAPLLSAAAARGSRRTDAGPSGTIRDAYKASWLRSCRCHIVAIRIREPTRWHPGNKSPPERSQRRGSHVCSLRASTAADARGGECLPSVMSSARLHRL